LSDWSRDGRFLLFDDLSKGVDFWVLPLEGDRKPYPFLETPFVEVNAHFSPDSRWIAYQLFESGPSEIYVRDFSGGPAPSKGKWQISSSGGAGPRWRADGRELFYRNGGKLFAVPVFPSTTEFRTGPPKLLFEMPPGATLQGPRRRRQPLPPRRSAGRNPGRTHHRYPQLAAEPEAISPPLQSPRFVFALLAPWTGKFSVN
jgi:hypothetical protein